MSESICLQCEHKRICATGIQQPSENVTVNGCSSFEQKKPQTNADRIRAMSDEELAEWIYQVQDGDAYQKENYLPPLSKSWWLKWLKQEAT